MSSVENAPFMLSEIKGFLAGTSFEGFGDSIEPLDGGRTSDVFVVSNGMGAARFVLKVARATSGTPLFDNRPKDEWRTICCLAPHGIAPMPVCFRSISDGITLTVYHFVAGALGAANAESLASLLRAVHGVEMPNELPNRATKPNDLLAQASALLSEVGPLPRWASALEPREKTADLSAEPRLIHCDPIASNIVTDAKGSAVLIDWQCPSVGDPIEDLAHATSPGMAAAYKAPPPEDVWEVLDHYGDLAVSDRAKQVLPFYRWRMLCYCHWKAAMGSDQYSPAMEREAEALESVQSKRNQQA